MQIINCGRGVHKREVIGIDKLRRLPSSWYAFTNLDMATGVGRSREIDVVIVADDRIFLVDLKDWSGRIESQNGAWLHNGRDTGDSPVSKIHQNAKDLGYLLVEHVKKYAKGPIPRVIGMVIITQRADLRGISQTEIGSVMMVDDFIEAVSTPSTRVAKFRGVNRAFVDSPLTGALWKDQLSKFFNARTGKIRPGQRRYASFVAVSEYATFEHPKQIFSEYEAFDENAAQTLGTIRIWDFSKASMARFQNEEARQEIAGRERAVIEFLKDCGESCENAVLHSRAEDPERGVGYWEVFDRRQRLKRLTAFVTSEAGELSRGARLELARQLISRVSALHSADAAHLDLGGHSIWLEAPSTVKLSHLMAAHFPQVASLGLNRYQFLACASLPEDILGGDNEPKRRDVFSLAVAVHWLLFSKPPMGGDEEGPFEWSAKVDESAEFAEFHPWFEKCLSLDPAQRFKSALEALDAYNAVNASCPSAQEVLRGLERFRGDIRSQRQLFGAFPEVTLLRESARVDIWTSLHDGKQVVVKLWKSAALGDRVKEGPRILDFLIRAQDLAFSPPEGCAQILRVLWLDDALAIIQAFVEGPNLTKALADKGFFGNSGGAVNFAVALTNCIITLHGQGISHGDLKPDNIIASGMPLLPVLIDIVDFSSSDDGEIVSSAYSPASGGRMERDRFAVTKIVEEILVEAELTGAQRIDIATAIHCCRNGPPENGTLLPLLEALERVLAPSDPNETVTLKLSIVGASIGPVLADEGFYYMRKLMGKPGFAIRGACEEVEVLLDDQGHPYRAKRVLLDQGRITRLKRHEVVAHPDEIEIERSDINDFSNLAPLLHQWSTLNLPNGESENIPLPNEASKEGEPDLGPAFEDATFDKFSDSPTITPKPIRLNVRQLWRELIDAENALTTEGVARSESTYNRDIRRHVVPLELTNGTFDFNRNDRVGVERLDRKKQWRRIGELDIARSKPDRVFIDTAEISISRQSGLISEEERLRFISHFEVQSFKRRESAISRVLDGRGRVRDMVSIFESDTQVTPFEIPHECLQEDLVRYGFNPTQEAAFRKLIKTRPLGALQGPPGTGKTQFIAALVHYALTKGLVRNVLLASQSHEAVNNAGEAVLKLFSGEGEQPSILRVGNEGVVSERLIPFHTDRLEQLYKDRFRAEMRERLRGAGRVLGLPDSVLEAIIHVETTLRPVAEQLAELHELEPPNSERLTNLLATLRGLIHQMDLTGVDEATSDQALAVLDTIIEAVSGQLPAHLRPAPEMVARLRALAEVGRDFVSSVSTAQRSFETFLAGTRQIVAGTCVGLGRPSLGLTVIPFDLVVIDEAARCTASELSVPMQAGRWIVLVGDQAQLEPQHEAKVVSNVASQVGISEQDVLRSDFERLFANGYGAAAGARLNRQYRMLPAIGDVVSKTFYEGKLEHGRTEPKIPLQKLPYGLDKPLTWLNTDCLGSAGEEQREESGSSRINPAEAEIIVALLKQWAGEQPFISWVNSQTDYAQVIGVICMYAAQRDLVRKKIQAANLPDTFRRAIKIDTVDSYQGKENPIVIVSIVRNNTDGSVVGGVSTIKPGFLGKKNRINVAISRAMDRLVIVGAKSRWHGDGYMHRLAEEVESAFSNKMANISPANIILDHASGLFKDNKQKENVEV